MSRRRIIYLHLLTNALKTIFYTPIYNQYLQSVTTITYYQSLSPTISLLSVITYMLYVSYISYVSFLYLCICTSVIMYMFL